MRRIATSSAFAALLAGAALLGACDRPPGGEKREWTADDHDKGDQMQTGQVKTAPAASGVKDDGMLVDVVWQNQCSPCHGPMGRGDGPNGPLLKAPDLTREEWQAKVTDEEIAKTIKLGRGQMPKFEMTDKLLAGVVKRIRLLRGMR